ncbi:MAG: DUF3568 family protein [Nitrospirota bacterium]
MKTAGTIVAALAVVILALQGCAGLVAGGAAGAAAATYVQGNYETAYSAPLDRTWGATLNTLRAMNMTVTETEKSLSEASVEARMQDGTDVNVTLTRSSPTVTAASIRVGLIGDEEASRMISRRIEERLAG